MLKNNDIVPRLATRFLIKAGGQKKKGDKTHPEKWDHFKVCSTERDDIGNPEPQEEWMLDNVGTTEPTEIPFMFFTNDPTQCYDDGYAYRTRTQRLCYSNDGITAQWQKNKREGQKDVKNPLPKGIEQTPNSTDDAFVVKCPGRDCPMQQSSKCKINLRLTGFIPRPEHDFKFQGADVFYSSSYNSAAQLRGSLQTLIMLTGGNIAFVPLTLKLQPKKAMVSGRQIEVYIVSFFPDESVDKLNARTLAGGDNRPDLALAPPEADFEENVTAEEYYPEEDEAPVRATLDEMTPEPEEEDGPPDDVYDNMAPPPDEEPDEVDSVLENMDAREQLAHYKREIWKIGKANDKSDGIIKAAIDTSTHGMGTVGEQVSGLKELYESWTKIYGEPGSLPGMD